MIPESLMKRRDSKTLMTIEVRHSDTLASLKDEDNTFISNSSTISTRSGITGLEPRNRGPPKIRRTRRQESLTSSTIVEKSPVESYEQPQSLPAERSYSVIPLEGRPVLEIEEEDITIKMLKALHANLERELQEKKERSERKKRMKKILKEEKERKGHSRKGSGDSERFDRSQDWKDMQLIQEKLKEQKRIEKQIEEQLKKESNGRDQRSVRDDRRAVVPADQILSVAKQGSFSTLKEGDDESSDDEWSRSRMRKEEEDDLPVLERRRSIPVALPKSPSKFETRSRHIPGSKNARMPPARRTSRDDGAGNVDGSPKQMARPSLMPEPFCSAADSVKLAKGGYSRARANDLAFEEESILSDRLSYVEPDSTASKAKERKPPSRPSRHRSTSEARNVSPRTPVRNERVVSTPTPMEAVLDQRPALPSRSVSMDDSFALFSVDRSSRHG